MSIFDEDEQEKSLDDTVILKQFLKNMLNPNLINYQRNVVFNSMHWEFTYLRIFRMIWYKVS